MSVSQLSRVQRPYRGASVEMERARQGKTETKAVPPPVKCKPSTSDSEVTLQAPQGNVPWTGDWSKEGGRSLVEASVERGFKS